SCLACSGIYLRGQVYIRRGGLDVLIKRPTAVAKIRKLAKRTGETLTDAVERAVEDRLARVRPRERKKGRIDRKRLAELLKYFDSLPVDDHRPHEEIVGSDEHGVPQGSQSVLRRCSQLPPTNPSAPRSSICSTPKRD